jgi:potassium efflux system protein
MSELVRLRPNAWLTRLRLGWYLLLVSIPLVQLVLAALGYMYTALSLQHRLGATLWTGLGLLTIYLIILRWVRLTHRRLAYEAAVQQRAAAQAAEEAGESEQEYSAAEDFAHIEADDTALDLERATASTRQLVGTIIGLVALVLGFLLWSELLPALAVLESIELWSTTTLVDGVETVSAVSAGEVLGFLLVILVTVLAARHLPGTLEILLLTRLPMDSGARYASTTLCRYLIVGVGSVVAFNTLGMSWSSIQWLVAALSVGLGFGLQEIVANFISGIIILFERPFRVGDIVTIGTTSGRVGRIQIRATTIVDWDRRELVVPNKQFITSEFINSTLSDTIARIRVPVGIAYGSDVALAKRLLLEAAEENDEVLPDPTPGALFLGFGDSALNIELRCFVADVNNRLGITDQLHMAIDEKLKRAGISIVFPQRDVHLMAERPVEVRVVGRSGTTEPFDEIEQSAR